ncbi:MAG: Bifunctional protein HldE [Chlamydiae bacterium]|nr:Bifunctional protein HldE [Chlamydiota bacterium]
MEMKLSGIFSQISQEKVLVAGDFLLDTYTMGSTSRISPEAPVPVVHVNEVSHRPGGAGNVALNMISLGLKVVTLGRIGKDESGDLLLRELESEGIETRGLLTQKSYKTPIKNRVIASNQQMLRIDFEELVPIAEDLENEVIDQIPSLLEEVKVVAISDYGKGFLSRRVLSALITQAREMGIPVITDPKGADFSKYAKSTLLKPNYKETLIASGLDEGTDIDLVGQTVLQRSLCDELLITRSEKGISYFPKQGCRKDFSVKVRQVKDVTGAGDTVLSVLTFCIANNFSMNIACRLSNIAAGLAIEVLGCARITLQDLAHRLLEEDVENKVFGDDHLYALQEVLRGRGLTLLGLEEDTQLSIKLLQTIRMLSVTDRDLLIYLRDGSPCEELVYILTSLKDVDYIIHNNESFRKLCQMVKPSDVYVFGQSELKKIDQVSLLL